jgi:hypothetical protein
MTADRILARAIRIPGLQRLWTVFPVGSIPTRTRFDIWKRPHYAYGVYTAADLAKRLKVPAISVIEFGVAGGRGLLELESIAREVGAFFQVRISVVGFDGGEGMPAPIDYRDLPYIWSKGFYKMDVERLKAKLTTASLVLGDLEETVPSFVQQKVIDPIGFVAFDLDYYSSTRKALRLFDSGHATRLPRVCCYFDEIIWPEIACHNEYIGELCAIREFNLEHSDTKLCPVHKLRNMRIHPACWNDQIYAFHDFQHPQYCANIGAVGDTEMAL